LSEYFGQAYEPASCGACDTCLGESEDLVDRTMEARKILSCVARVGQRFGAGHVVDVLRGADTERVRSLGHHELTTHGLLADLPKTEVTNMVYQLVDQELLERTTGEYPILALNERSWEVLRGERTVAMLPTRRKKKKRAAPTTIERESWEGVDRGLFERLRALRTSLARERGVPPYVIFGDASLRDMAKKRPATPEELLGVHGVGEKKLADLGEAFLEVIASSPR
jgi:ATP-dependent DNA helicase RecQ